MELKIPVIYADIIIILISHVFAETVSETNVMKINRTNSEDNSLFISNSTENSKFNTSAEETELFEGKSSFFPPDLRRIVVALNALPNGLCKNDSRAVLESVISREKWALKMFDSSPKFPVGMFYGNYYQLGNFDECVSINEKLTGYERKLQGKYCLADIVLDSGRENRFARSDGHYYIEKPSSRNYFNNTLHWSLCVPSSCSSNEIEVFLHELFKIAISYPVATIEVPDINCYYEKHIPFSTLEIIFGCFIGIFLAFVCLATIYHLLRIYHKTKRLDYTVNSQEKPRPKVYQQFILSFSLIKNVGKLVHVRFSELNLDCIAGIRFLSMLLIIVSHSIMFVIGGPVLNEDFFIKTVEKPQNAILLNHPLLVDTFLLISGFLMCRLLLLELEKRKGKINILALYIGRYVRLTPSYFIVIALYNTFLIRLDNGPLWNKVIATEQDRCMTSWWANLLYINNYVNTDNICMFQSWYLSADTHLFMIAPFIVYPLWKWPRIGEVLLAFSTIAGAFIPFIITYIYQLDPTLMTYPSEMTDVTTNSYFVFAYIKTHMRAIAYCIGLIAGYIVHKVQASNIKLSNNVVFASWILATIFGVSAVFSITVFYLPNHQFNTLESASYSSLHKIAWSVSIAWIIIACVTDNSGAVNRFLSWSPFIPLSRLTYCAYLVNGLIELHSYGILRTSVYMSISNMAVIALGHVLLTFTAGFILCVLFESPLHNMEKIILMREPQPKNRQQQHTVVDNKL